MEECGSQMEAGEDEGWDDMKGEQMKGSGEGCRWMGEDTRIKNWVIEANGRYVFEHKEETVAFFSSTVQPAIKSYFISRFIGVIIYACVSMAFRCPTHVLWRCEQTKSIIRGKIHKRDQPKMPSPLPRVWVALAFGFCLGPRRNLELMHYYIRFGQTRGCSGCGSGQDIYDIEMLLDVYSSSREKITSFCFVF